MRNWMRLATPFALVMSCTLTAKAQMWGAGLYGGMQGCGYQQDVGDEATSILDEISELNEIVKDAKSELRQKKTELNRVKSKKQKAQRDIERTIADEYASEILRFMDNKDTCGEVLVGSIINTDNSRMPAGGGGSCYPQVNVTASKGGKPIEPDDQQGQYPESEKWAVHCPCGSIGRVSTSACTDGDIRGENGRSSDRCQAAITEYPKYVTAEQKLQSEVDDLEAIIDDAQSDIKLLKGDARDAARDYRREQAEGGICVDCLMQGSGYTYNRGKTDWTSVIGNVGLGLLASFMGHKNSQMISENNATIGWPTQPYPAVGYGMPFFAAGAQQALNGGSGIYGAVNGGMGAGGFGCSGMNGGPYGMMGPMGGMNGSGMWGNPYGMMPGMGGGMYMPGMGPWGMAGPWGGMGGGYPGGLMMSGGMGMMMPGGMGMMASGGMGMMMPGGMGMMAPGGMGMMASGGMGMMMPGGMGMMAPGGMGMMAPGGMGMMMPGGMGMMAAGGMGMMMPGGMGMMAPGGMMAMQMQQQMAQMQAQQYQYYMQVQQQYMQQEMAKQQTVNSLTQEMYGLMYRIQQVQMGGGGGGFYGGGFGGGFGGGGYMGGGYGGGSYIGGAVTTPLPGGGGASGLTPLPGSPGAGGGTTTTIPAPR